MYANDEETQKWGEIHSSELFKVNVLGWHDVDDSPSGSIFTVKYETEPSFEISFAHLWEHLDKGQRHELLAAGAVEPLTYDAAETAAEDMAAGQELAECCQHMLLIQLDGLPGSGKSYTSSKMQREHGFAFIELDEINCGCLP